MKSRISTYRGAAIEVTYDLARCIHVSDCIRSLPGVFDPSGSPWVRIEGAPAAEVAETVMLCPTGALKFKRLDGGPGEEPAAVNTVRIAPRGPLYLRGRIRILSEEAPVEDSRAALCRCGASKNKPFCDGRHERTGFNDPGLVLDDVPARRTSIEEPAEEDVLRVHVMPDGPLVVAGHFELIDAAGESQSCTRLELCRCGASATPPFCDGSHLRLPKKG
jgi:CDGSH-type Zn-finger protein/uncharacterized Fe-S cluster protein YjdI